ncbi:MAG: bifunctional adenosylcobinamide kinase/adenosylcobinamide-phosphate guanylyltransferase [Desulfomonilaceae bacterium]
MAKIILITGGTRSGKSEYARKTAEALPGNRAFVATCLATDEEMSRRIKKHQEERLKADWHTIEEPLELADTLRKTQGFDVLLVDCLTLWISNLMYETRGEENGLSEDDITDKTNELLNACSGLAGTVIFVTNEVGSGIVPEHSVSRLYRDLVGRCNQIVAQGADEVTLVACGLPLNLKRGRNE